jgi:hypothetical protein
MVTKEEIGCCSAYCRTCKEHLKSFCKGCKLGYSDGSRDINRAKCKIKLCCFHDRGFETCADCEEFNICDIIQPWFEKGYKYRRCKIFLGFIRDQGYEEFIKKADGWKDAYGKL